MMSFRIQGEVIQWRGPAPYYFLPTPPSVTAEIESMKSAITYGWGVVPARVTIGGMTFTTSLIPRDGSFYVPLKDALRKPQGIVAGDVIDVLLEI